VFASCSKKDEVVAPVSPVDTTKHIVPPVSNLKANETVASSTGNIKLNGMTDSISIAKYFGISATKSVSAVEPVSRVFYTLYFVPSDNKIDTMVYYQDLAFNKDKTFGNVSNVFKSTMIKKGMRDSIQNLRSKGNFAINNNKISLTDTTFLSPGMTRYSYSMTVIAIDKDGAYFTVMFDNKDTLTFYQVIYDNGGYESSMYYDPYTRISDLLKISKQINAKNWIVDVQLSTFGRYTKSLM
jgi:hypothetical protein